MNDSDGPRLALTVVRIASLLVPRPARGQWRLEWEAELAGRWQELVDRSALSLGTRADLVRRAMGSLVDALFYRDGRWGMNGFWHDVRLAARGLARRPGFTGVVVMTLVVGIGANTTIYSVARDVLLEPFPYPEPDRVVVVEDIHTTRPDVSGNVTYPNISDLDAATESFTGIGALRWWVPALEDDRGSVVLRGAIVTGNFFEILGVQAGQGRLFRPDEQGEGRENTVVVSHALWSGHFGADPGLVGSEIRLSGVSHRVVGVTSPDFEDPWLMAGPGAEPQIWRTVDSPPSEWPRSGRSWAGIARVRSDVSLEVAQDEIAGAFAGLVEEYPEHNGNQAVRITPIRESIAGPVEPVMYTLLASVGLLLLIACANLANLLLGRALDRRGEVAMHRALGAPGWRILHRSLAEVAILSILGGIGGVVFAVGLGRVAAEVGTLLPRPITGAVDGGVLLFAAAATGAAGLLFGLAPALHALRVDEALPGRDAARGRTPGRSSHRLRRSLVVGELALTTALLVGSGLMVRSFQRLGAVELGLETSGVIAMDLHGSAWWELEPAAAQAQWDAVLAAVRDAPGVEAVGAIDYIPLSGNYSCDGTRRADLPAPEPGEGRCAEVRVVLPGALEALGLPLVRGRFLDARDGLDQPPTVVIDENLAETYWPGEDPIGGRLMVHTRTHEVVGVVGDMKVFGPGGAARPMLYLNAPQEGWNGVTRGLALLVRGTDVESLVGATKGAVAEVATSIAVGEVVTLDGLLRDTLAAPRFRTVLMSSFAITALLLAVLGITGVMSYSVARRTRELGVRLALGAEPTEVRSLVLGEGTRLVALGVALGAVGALAVAGVLDALLFEVSARDPSVYATVILLLAGTATAACYVPASRASRVDPIAALGSE